MKTQDIIHEIRPKLRHKCNLALLDYLSSLESRRKVKISDQRYMRLASVDGEEWMYLPLMEPSVPDPRIQCDDEMREFYSVFNGLREMEPPTAGHFVPCAEVALVKDEYDLDILPEVCRQAECPIIFHATNGDVVIKRRDGSFAWCVLSEDKVKKLANSFSQFLLDYVAYRLIGDGYPFDSYGR